MSLSYEYIQFLNEKVLEFLPQTYFKIGDKLNMRCPLCGDSRKSVFKKRGWYYLKTASYYCFNCSTGMSGIKFLEYISGNNYEQIRKDYLRLYLKIGLNATLSTYFEEPTEEPSMFELESIVNPVWKKPLSKKAKQYLKDRKIFDAPFKKENLYSYITKNSNEYILIPWIVNGVEAYYQLNDYQKVGSLKYIFPRDKKKLLYGLDNIDISWNKIIITEGVYDSMFIKNGVSSGTKSITEYQLNLIKERYPKHQVILAFDNDKPGIKSTVKLLKENNTFKYFKWFDYNTKQKDINDYVLFKNDVNIFTDINILENLIVDKLSMKMYLIKNNLWINN